LAILYKALHILHAALNDTKKYKGCKKLTNLSLVNKFRKLYSHVYVTLSNPDNRIITTNTKKPISASAQRSFLRFNSREQKHSRTIRRDREESILTGLTFQFSLPTLQEYIHVVRVYVNVPDHAKGRERERENEGGRRSISSLTSQATTCRRLDLSRPIIERKQFINRPCASKQIDRIAQTE